MRDEGYVALPLPLPPMALTSPLSLPPAIPATPAPAAAVPLLLCSGRCHRPCCCCVVPAVAPAIPAAAAGRSWHWRWH